jgi:hypothetical protein
VNYQHKQLAQGRWKELPFVEQMGNVGSEIERTILWKEKGNPNYSNLAFERALELIDLTIANAKTGPRLRELTRTREGLVDHFIFSNEYGTTDECWKKYFFCFAYAAQLRRASRAIKLTDATQSSMKSSI